MTKMRLMAVIAGVCLAVALCTGCAASAAQGVQTSATSDINTVDMAYVQDQLGSAKIVDARTFEEFAGKTGDQRPGHIPDAISIRASKLIDKDGKPMSATRLVRMFEHQTLSPEDEIIVYDAAGGQDASKVAEALLANGYDNVSIYEGGYAEWSADTANEVSDHVEACCAV